MKSISYFFRNLGGRIGRELGLNKLLWKAGLSHEVSFWSRYLATGGLRWKEDFAERLDPGVAFQDRLRGLVNVSQGGVVEVLDVGAGPLTVLGKAWPGVDLRITAVDPLASQYDRMLKQHKIEPPVRTEFCRGEELLEKFSRDRFHLAYARNCLDHSEVPIRAIEQMLAVVRPGGIVVLEHWPNEGEAENYRGLHQWNFCCEEGRFLIWNQRNRIDVNQYMAGQSEVTCEMMPEEGREMVVVRLRKPVVSNN